MKNYATSMLLSGAIVFILSACGNNPGKPSEATTAVEPAKARVVQPADIFENDYAKVISVSLAPGDSLASHQGGARVIYSLSDYSIEWTEGERNQGVKSWKKGDVHFHEPGIHAARNNGATTAEWLAFIKKDAELPDCSGNTLEKDVNAAAPGFAKQLFDNERFRITEVSLPKGEKIPAHSGVNRIIYSLSDYSIIYESDKEGRSEKQFKVGDVHWHESCRHSLENTGETEAVFLVVAFKK